VEIRPNFQAFCEENGIKVSKILAIKMILSLKFPVLRKLLEKDEYMGYIVRVKNIRK
jgi:hypothetical protein